MLELRIAYLGWQALKDRNEAVTELVVHTPKHEATEWVRGELMTCNASLHLHNITTSTTWEVIQNTTLNSMPVEDLH